MFFAAYGLAQLPVGAALDRHGPRRVQAALMLAIAAAALAFAAAQGLGMLVAGRVLLGVGVSAALMAQLKATREWFPAASVATVAGWCVGLSALGGVVATVPAEALTGLVGWRGVFVVIAAIALAAGLWIWRSVPERLVIASIALEAPIIPVHYRDIEVGGQVYHQWRVPSEFAAGWQDTSARLGLPGNTVLNGHHNAYGRVIENLAELRTGDVIQVYSGEWEYRYAVAAKLLLPERGQRLEVRMENARWLAASEDERLTLVTCWPAESNTHRLIVIAYPLGRPVHHPPPLGETP